MYLTTGGPVMPIASLSPEEHIHIYIRICVCVCVCIYIYIHIHMYTYARAHTHTHTHIRVYLTNACPSEQIASLSPEERLEWLLLRAPPGVPHAMARRLMEVSMCACMHACAHASFIPPTKELYVYVWINVYTVMRTWICPTRGTKIDGSQTRAWIHEYAYAWYIYVHTWIHVIWNTWQVVWGCDVWHVACDMCNATWYIRHVNDMGLTCDIWHVTCDMWHVTWDMGHGTWTWDMGHGTCARDVMHCLSCVKSWSSAIRILLLNSVHTRAGHGGRRRESIGIVQCRVAHVTPLFRNLIFY